LGACAAQVRDAEGRKMSKSLGNVVDPVDTIREYGTDALRFTLATGWQSVHSTLWIARCGEAAWRPARLPFRVKGL
jgi:valyl-tRNA synthetase